MDELENLDHSAGFLSIKWQKIKAQPLSSFIVVHTIIFLIIFIGVNSGSQPAEFERSIALRMLNGQLPYVDFSIEYPPLALLSFLLPSVVSRVSPLYSWFFAIEMLIADLMILALLNNLASRFKVSNWETLGAYSVFILAVGALITNRYDIIPTMLLMSALYAFIMKKNKICWAIMAMGIMSKAFPAVVAPIFALYYLRYKQYRTLAVGILTSAIVILVITLPWILMSEQGFLNMLQYHASRGLHSESAYGTALLVQMLLGMTSVQGVFNFGSWNLSSPMADYLARMSPFITVGLLAIVYVLFAYHVWDRPRSLLKKGNIDQDMVGLIFRYSLLAVLVFLVSSKVFSPQFLIWICPLVPFVRTRWRYAFWSMFLIVAGITQYIFPYNYISFEMFVFKDVAIMAVRNFLLLVMAIWLILPLDAPAIRIEERIMNNARIVLAGKKALSYSENPVVNKK